MTIPDEVMKHMAKILLEKATEAIAQNAEHMAYHQATEKLTGREALLIFAETIRETNLDQFPRGAEQ